jgi:hypothetical protein
MVQVGTAKDALQRYTEKIRQKENNGYIAFMKANRGKIWRLQCRLCLASSAWAVEEDGTGTLASSVWRRLEKP